MLRPLAWCLGLSAAATALTVGTAAAPFAVALAGGVGIGAAGNFGHELCKALDRRVLQRVMEGRSSIAENHVIVQTLRLAELKALGVILRRFDNGRGHERRPERVSEAARVSAELARFVREETRAAETLTFVATGEATAAERALQQDVLKILPVAFDKSLALRRMAGDKVAIAESLAQFRRIAEAAVLAELRLSLFAPGEEFPATFTALFIGSGATDGWFDLFLRDTANRIKAVDDDNGAFEKIWNAEQIALIKAITEAYTAVLDRIDARTERIEEGIAELPARLLMALEERGVLQSAETSTLAQHTIMSLAQRLNPKETLTFDQAINELKHAVQIAVNLEQNRVPSTDESHFVKTVIDEAETDTLFLTNSATAQLTLTWFGCVLRLKHFAATHLCNVLNSGNASVTTLTEILAALGITEPSVAVARAIQALIEIGTAKITAADNESKGIALTVLWVGPSWCRSL